jgi:hypothetical protein
VRCELACALDCREHAQATIEPPATWDAIEMTPDDEPPRLSTGQNHPDVPGLVALDRRPGELSTGALEDSFALARPDIRPCHASPATPRVEFAKLTDYARGVHVPRGRHPSWTPG